jgi:hypothetical protein
MLPLRKGARAAPYWRILTTTAKSNFNGHSKLIGEVTFTYCGTKESPTVFVSCFTFCFLLGISANSLSIFSELLLLAIHGAMRLSRAPFPFAARVLVLHASLIEPCQGLLPCSSTYARARARGTGSAAQGTDLAGSSVLASRRAVLAATKFGNGVESDLDPPLTISDELNLKTQQSCGRIVRFNTLSRHSSSTRH